MVAGRAPESRCRRFRRPAPCRRPYRPPGRGACRLARLRPLRADGSGCARPSRSARARPSGCTCTRIWTRASSRAVPQHPRCLRHAGRFQRTDRCLQHPCGRRHAGCCLRHAGRFQPPRRFRQHLRRAPRSEPCRRRSAQSESRSYRLRPAAPQARRYHATILPTHRLDGRLRRLHYGRSRHGLRGCHQRSSTRPDRSATCPWSQAWRRLRRRLPAACHGGEEARRAFWTRVAAFRGRKGGEYGTPL